MTEETSAGSKRKSRSSPATNHIKRHSISLNHPIVTELAPECNAGVRVTFRDVTAAAYRTKSGIQKTPLVVSFVCVCACMPVHVCQCITRLILLEVYYICQCYCGLLVV